MEEFNSLKELYDKVRPALTVKRNDLKKLGINYVKEEDIWNCLKEQKWLKANSLSLSEMVNDILECNSDTIDMYIKKQMSKIEKHANTEGDSFI
jgi:hypothetical protein